MKLVSLLIGAVSTFFAFIGAAIAAQPTPWQMWHQPAGSEMMARIEWFDKYTFWFIVPITIFVMILLFIVITKFSAKNNPNPSRTSHNTFIEVVWTVVPIIVLVAINQPFTLWMLHSFFESIPKELDESAKVDGCTQFQAFRHVIIPVMWPGVITTGLFSFLLAYNDFAVTATVLQEENRTMVPAINAFLGTTQTEGNVMFAVSAVVSATAPLFVLVMFFQRQIVSGLTAGAVKG